MNPAWAYTRLWMLLLFCKQKIISITGESAAFVWAYVQYATFRRAGIWIRYIRQVQTPVLARHTVNPMRCTLYLPAWNIDFPRAVFSVNGIAQGLDGPHSFWASGLVSKGQFQKELVCEMGPLKFIIILSNMFVSSLFIDVRSYFFSERYIH